MADPECTDEPVDPDLEPRASQHRPDVLAAIAVGGAIGAFGRYEAGLHWPVRAGAFPTTTFLINTSGALLIGLVLVLIVERWSSPRLARPFAVIGVLGAWTTMSTLATESDLLVRDGHAMTALAYVVCTIVAGLAATWLGISVARRFVA
jgi:CrcB protein